MITDNLKTILANHIEGSLTVQGYHFNIEGIEFNQYHNFFSEIYKEYHDQIDTLAEYIRIVSDSKEYVNISASIVKLNTTIVSNPVVGGNSPIMCKEIISINNILSKNFTDIFNLATTENHIGLADYCSCRIDYHNKLNWKLLAITK
jgi:starvation-inducible DNA-binding protein